MPTEAPRAVKHARSSVSAHDEAFVDSRFRAYAAEVAGLKEKLMVFETTVHDLKLKLKEKDVTLKETQTLLGQYVVAANRQAHTEPIVTVPTNAQLPEPSRKRARSPSLEIVEMPELCRKKGKAKEKLSMSTPPTTPPDPVPSGFEPLFATPEKTKILEPSSPLKVVKLSPSEKKYSKIEPRSEEKARHTHSTARLDKEGILASAGTSNATSSTSPSVLPADYEQDEIDPNDFHCGPGSLSQLPKTRLPTSRGEVDLKYKAKVKKEVNVKDVFNLPPSTIKRHLASATPLIINPPPLDLEVPRALLRLAYGGSDQHFLQFIQEEKNPSGPHRRRIVFPMLDMNPVMPSAPGDPGLVFASRHEILSNPPWSLFCKRSMTAPAVWLYLGEYETVLCGMMTAEQFKAQTLKTKEAWAELILKSKVLDVYVAMRARIALRKDYILPAQDKESEEKLVNAEIAMIKKGKGRELAEKDVIRAFSNGDEGIDIIRMTCTTYDHVFANDIKDKYANYEALVMANKRKKEGVKAKKKPRKSGAGKQGEAPERLRKVKKQGRISKSGANSDAMSVDVSDGQEEGGAGSDLDYIAPPGSDRETSYPGSASASRPRRRAAARMPSFSYLNDDDDDELGSPFGGSLTDIEDN